jgi:hypothetical protein
MPLSGVLAHLWELARLNSWAPDWKRDWWRVQRQIMRVAGTTDVYARLLSDVMYVPPAYRRELAALIDAGWMAFCDGMLRTGTEIPQRLILGEIKSIEETPHGHRMHLRHQAAPLYLSDEVRAAMFERHGRALSSIGRQMPHPSRVVVLAQVELSRAKSYLRVVDAAVQLCSELWIPCATGYEVALANTLTSAGRAFERPMRLHDQDTALPDFVLRDTGDKPTALQILSVEALPYLERKLMLRAQLRDAGFDVWTWRVSESAAPPPLRPARNAAASA